MCWWHMTDMLMALFLVFPQQTLLLQMNEMKSQVDEVRDLAITLMSRSDRFTPMVEPELTHLNQHWVDVRRQGSGGDHGEELAYFTQRLEEVA